MVEAETDVSAIVFNSIEFYFKCGLTEDEQEAIGVEFFKKGIESFINGSGRILVVNADELTDATPILAKYGLIEQILKIKHVIEYDIIYDENPQIVVSLH